MKNYVKLPKCNLDETDKRLSEQLAKSNNLIRRRIAEKEKSRAYFSGAISTIGFLDKMFSDINLNVASTFIDSKSYPVLLRELGLIDYEVPENKYYPYEGKVFWLKLSRGDLKKVRAYCLENNCSVYENGDEQYEIVLSHDSKLDDIERLMEISGFDKLAYMNIRKDVINLISDGAALGYNLDYCDQDTGLEGIFRNDKALNLFISYAKGDWDSLLAITGILYGTFYDYRKVLGNLNKGGKMLPMSRAITCGEDLVKYYITCGFKEYAAMDRAFNNTKVIREKLKDDDLLIDYSVSPIDADYLKNIRHLKSIVSIGQMARKYYYYPLYYKLLFPTSFYRVYLKETSMFGTLARGDRNQIERLWRDRSIDPYEKDLWEEYLRIRKVKPQVTIAEISNHELLEEIILRIPPESMRREVISRLLKLFPGNLKYGNIKVYDIKTDRLVEPNSIEQERIDCVRNYYLAEPFYCIRNAGEEVIVVALMKNIEDMKILDEMLLDKPFIPEECVYGFDKYGDLEPLYVGLTEENDKPKVFIMK